MQIEINKNKAIKDLFSGNHKGLQPNTNVTITIVMPATDYIDFEKYCIEFFNLDVQNVIPLILKRQPT